MAPASGDEAHDRQRPEPVEDAGGDVRLSIMPVPRVANTTDRTKMPGSENCRYWCVPPAIAPPKT